MGLIECARHPKYKKIIEVGDSPDETTKQFEMMFPEGGCTRKCESRLDCGHLCPLTCHPEERHDTVKCNAKCERTCPRGHKFCKKRCYKDKITPA